MYRAKRIDNNEFTYGYLFKIWEKAYILWGTTNGIPNMKEVHPKTICKRIELKDKNGIEIYENDILKSGRNWRDNVLVTVKYGNTILIAENEVDWTLDNKYRRYYNVIGNIYDTPDLLKGELMKEYAIRNKKSGKFITGTDMICFPPRKILDESQPPLLFTKGYLDLEIDSRHIDLEYYEKVDAELIKGDNNTKRYEHKGVNNGKK